MKKLILLSSLTACLLAQNSVSYIEVDQVNKIIDSTFSEEGVKSQGATTIEDGAFVDNVHVLQKPSVDEEVAGNLIIDTTVTSAGTQIHQGLTHVKSGAKLQDAELKSINEINNLKATGGESFVSQANIIIGEDSNVTNLLNNGSNSIGDGTADRFTISQENILKDSSIKNTSIHQGLIVIDNGADASGLDITQKNSIKRSSGTGENEINASQISQGEIKIEDGTAKNITENIDNSIDNLTIDGSQVSQATLHAKRSEITHLNNKLNSSNPNDGEKNEIVNVDIIDARLEQSTMDIDNSSVNILNRFDRGNLQQNNLIHTLSQESNSTIKQSTLEIKNEATLSNVEYLTADNPSSGQDAINEIKQTDIADNSAIYQDSVVLDDASLEDTLFNRTNRIKDANMGNDSTLYQFYTHMKQTELRDSKLSSKSVVDDVYINHSSVAQSATTIVD